MEARAYLRNVRISPRKVKIVLDLIRNKPVDYAMAVIKHTPKAACEDLEKLLKSAVSNAENNHDMDKEKLYVAEYDLQAIRTGVLNGDINVITDNDNQIVDTSKLSQKGFKAYQTKSNIAKDIVKSYGPTFLGLMGKKHKEPISVK